MRINHSSMLRTLITLATSACMGGTGSLLTGVSGNGGGGNTTASLSFFVQPNTANVGQVISPPVEVLARDSLGGTDSAFSGTITVSLASNSTGATLSGTTAVGARDGIATFSNLAVDKAGTYTLQASAAGATAVTSSSFTITSPVTP